MIFISYFFFFFKSYCCSVCVMLIVPNFRVKNISIRDPHAVEESKKGSKADILISSKVLHPASYMLICPMNFSDDSFVVKLQLNQKWSGLVECMVHNLIYAHLALEHFVSVWLNYFHGAKTGNMWCLNVFIFVVACYYRVWHGWGCWESCEYQPLH